MSKTIFKPTFFPILFLLIVISDLLVGSLETVALRYYTKPLILFSLLLYFAYNGKFLGKAVYILMLMALICSWLGDVFLMYDEVSPNYFMLGLVSFLMAHIIYSVVFLKQRNNKLSTGFWMVLTALVVYGAVLFFLLKDRLGDLMIHVIIYVVMILFMALTAFLRKGTVNPKSFTLVFLGALFFIASDSILAINKFLDAIPYSHILVMGTYATAQYLIVKGVLNQKNP